MKKACTTVLVLLCAIASPAQKKAMQWQGIVTGGVVVGNSGAELQAHGIGGIRWQQWSVGLGSGVDDYLQSTIPVFVHLRRRFGSGRTAGFAYVSGGYNWPAKDPDIEFRLQDWEGGVYADAGLGFSVPAFKTRELLFSVGMGHKALRETVNTLPYLSVWPPPRTAYQTYKYNLTTVSFKTGFRF